MVNVLSSTNLSMDGDNMAQYKFYQRDYTFKYHDHQGFGGEHKYIATPNNPTLPTLLIKHEHIHAAANEFLHSRLADLVGVYAPCAYIMDSSDDGRDLFALPCIVGIEYIDDITFPDYDQICNNPDLTKQYLQAVALYRMLGCHADILQIGYAPSTGVWAYDFEESFDISEFLVKLNFGVDKSMTPMYTQKLEYYQSNYDLARELDICFEYALHTLNLESSPQLLSQFLIPLKNMCHVKNSAVKELLMGLGDNYPPELLKYYEGFIALLQKKLQKYLACKTAVK